MKKVLAAFLTMISIHLFAQPANDAPCNAINLTVDTIGYNLTCTPTSIYSWTFANPSLPTAIPAPTCGIGNNVWNDVWFKFTVPGTGSINIFTAAGNIACDPVMEAYSANSCSGTFTSKGCNDDYNGSYPALLLSGLTPGSIIYLRIWIFNGIVDGDIKICITGQSPASDPSKKVGIGIKTPQANLDVNGSSILRGELKMESNNKGLILPRLDDNQMNNMIAPLPGTVVFNTTESALFMFSKIGWARMSNDWTAFENHIYNNNSGNVGIGNIPYHARMEITGSVGAAVAIFGSDKYGVTIEADNPEIGFNYLFNGGTKTIKAGKAANIGMSPSSGDIYIGNFSNNVSTTDFGAISGYQTVMTIKQNGRVGLLIDPTRAAFEQNGVVGNTAAIFGGEGAGISLQRNWPAIGFNHYYDGNNSRAIGAGYSGQMALNQSNGTLYWTSYGSTNYAANEIIPIQFSNFGIDVYGHIGVGTAAPTSEISIVNDNNTFDNIHHGIKIEQRAYNGGWWYPWNTGVSTFNGFMQFSYNGIAKATISSIDGAYWNPSDKNLKKEISNFNSPVLSKILSLNPVNYLMKDEATNSKKHFGFLSQEVETIFPELVMESSSIKLMNYSGLIPILTKGVQEQQQQIETLKNENRDLKWRLEQLEKIMLKK
jgi:hypothetical protein